MAKGFYQRRNDLMGHILDSGDLTITQKCIGMKLLIGYMNSNSEHAWMSAGRLARDLGIAVETVRRALKALVQNEFLTANRRCGETTVYEMGPAYRYVAHPRSGSPLPPARAPRDPRRQSHPNLMNEPKNNPFAETRRKRDAGGLRRLSIGQIISEHDITQHSTGNEAPNTEPRKKDILGEGQDP